MGSQTKAPIRLKPIMTRSLYYFGIYLFILLLVFVSFYAIIYYQMDVSLYGMNAFRQYYVVSFILNTLASIVLLRYFHIKKFQFALYSALFVLLAGTANFFFVFNFLNTGNSSEYILPASILYLLSGIPYGFGLIFSKAGKRSWLKIAGIFHLVSTSSLLLTLLLRLSAEFNLQDAHQWIGIVANLVFLLYAKNFSEELKENPEEALNEQPKSLLKVFVGLVGAMALASVLIVGIQMSQETSWWIFEKKSKRADLSSIHKEPYVPKVIDTVGTNKKTAIEMFGHLQVDGNRIIGSNGEPVQLRGLSLFWSQWIGKYYNYDAVKWLRDDWKINVIRVAMAVDHGGYASNPQLEKSKVITVVEAAIDLGIYVIIDFHAHHADDYEEEAKVFFTEMAQRYGHLPNVIYEPWNEPVNVSWNWVIKPYHEEIIRVIRQHDKDNLIVCGTRNWSQKVKQASLDPISDVNVAYTLHYYAATPGHQASLRKEARDALDNGAALFVTEYGLSNAPSLNTINEKESRLWWAFLDENHISHCKWSVGDKEEISSILYPGAPSSGGWTMDQITRSGHMVRDEIRAKNP